MDKNMVDERFECISVIFRLAGAENYDALESDYQKEVTEKFAKYSEHPAVKMIRSFQSQSSNDFEVWIGYHCALQFIVHLEEEKRDGRFVFIKDIDSMFSPWNWNKTVASNFLNAFNNFYIDTDYAEFYKSKIPLFEEATQKFIDETYGKIDFKWFEKYIDPSNLRCIYSLSSGNYAATVNDKIVYCLVWGSGKAIVHEYCHYLAKNLADEWYNTNQQFKFWCDGSINIEKMPYYGCGIAMANEYITRAYNILYNVRHGASLEEELSKERNHVFENSFKFIDEVYKMVLEL